MSYNEEYLDRAKSSVQNMQVYFEKLILDLNFDYNKFKNGEYKTKEVGQLTSLYVEISELEDYLDSLESEVNELTEEVEELEDQVSDWEDNFGTLKNIHDNLKTPTTYTEAELLILCLKVYDNIDRLDQGDLKILKILSEKTF